MDEEEFDLKRIGCVLRGPERVSTESRCSGEGKEYVTLVWRMSCSSKIRRLQHGSPRRPLRDDAEDVDRLRDSQREGRRRITPRCILPRVLFFPYRRRSRHIKEIAVFRRDGEELLTYDDEE